MATSTMWYVSREMKEISEISDTRRKESSSGRRGGRKGGKEEGREGRREGGREGERGIQNVRGEKGGKECVSSQQSVIHVHVHVYSTFHKIIYSGFRVLLVGAALQRGSGHIWYKMCNNYMLR